MQFNSRQFKALKDSWYKKLKKSGFNDIETADGALKKSHTDLFSVYHADYGSIYLEAKEEYFRLARQLLHDYKFSTPQQKLVWQLHSEGLSIRTIIKVLKSKNYPGYRDLVHGIIKKLSKEMRAKLK